MELVLQRRESKEKTTIGILSVDDKLFCITLEDEIRELGPNASGKIYGETAIPAGRYEVTITFSPKFQHDMMLVNNVPGFTGIRIHSGNTSEDTLGCILVGHTEDSPRRIHGGSKVLPQLFDEVRTAIDGGQSVHITVCNPAPLATQATV